MQRCAPLLHRRTTWPAKLQCRVITDNDRHRHSAHRLLAGADTDCPQGTCRQPPQCLSAVAQNLPVARWVPGRDVLKCFDLATPWASGPAR